ncbi:MAG: tetratricopeptide repeat protein [Gemmataceae bacterium]
MARSRLCVLMLLTSTIVVWGDSPAPEKDKEKKPGVAGKASDVPLVERLLAARKEYQLTLESLRKHYIQTGDVERARWAEEELVQYHRVTKQVYRLELDVPPPTLKAQQNIPEANKLYRQALTYKDKGWGNDYIDNQRRSELLLQKLLTEYPQSNKISDSAYMLGDIYESKAFRQLHRAAAYYDRCYEWNKSTQFDARIRAARLYERQLNDRAKAAQIYRDIITHETDDRVIDEARKRLQDLSNRR